MREASERLEVAAAAAAVNNARHARGEGEEGIYVSRARGAADWGL